MRSNSWTKEKFIKNVQVNINGCWPWWLGKDPFGYGRTGHLGKIRGAHVIAWMVFRGDVPVGYEVHHKCNRRDCVNPDHLELLTKLAHYHHHDWGAKLTHCRRGHPLSGDNLYMNRSGPNARRRFCRECKNTAARRGYWSRK